jgi:hypothetical protein
MCEARARLATCGAAQSLHDVAQTDEAKVLAHLSSVVDRYERPASAPIA